jgi:hypothetical protein
MSTGTTTFSLKKDTIRLLFENQTKFESFLTRYMCFEVEIEPNQQPRQTNP